MKKKQGPTRFLLGDDDYSLRGRTPSPTYMDDYYPPIKRIVYGEQHRRAFYEEFNSRFAKMGIDLGVPMTIPAAFPGSIDIMGVDGNMVFHNFNKPGGSLYAWSVIPLRSGQSWVDNSIANGWWGTQSGVRYIASWNGEETLSGTYVRDSYPLGESGGIAMTGGGEPLVTATEGGIVKYRTGGAGRIMLEENGYALKETTEYRLYDFEDLTDYYTYPSWGYSMPEWVDEIPILADRYPNSFPRPHTRREMPAGSYMPPDQLWDKGWFFWNFPAIDWLEQFVYDTGNGYNIRGNVSCPWLQHLPLQQLKQFAPTLNAVAAETVVSYGEVVVLHVTEFQPNLKNLGVKTNAANESLNKTRRYYCAVNIVERAEGWSGGGGFLGPCYNEWKSYERARGKFRDGNNPSADVGHTGENRDCFIVFVIEEEHEGFFENDSAVDCRDQNGRWGTVYTSWLDASARDWSSGYLSGYSIWSEAWLTVETSWAGKKEVCRGRWGPIKYDEHGAVVKNELGWTTLEWAEGEQGYMWGWHVYDDGTFTTYGGITQNRADGMPSATTDLWGYAIEADGTWREFRATSKDVPDLPDLYMNIGGTSIPADYGADLVRVEDKGSPTPVPYRSIKEG